ncbi:MAG: malto-oligosyltrehalose trehalohydrolase [Planctomycetaceae bacterium]|nr:MAG: malto-oligosyltrehalose trehalohydrolase [Planctomycetaceae bacterium]
MSKGIDTDLVFPQPVHGIPGALRQDDGTVHWRLWAPKHESLSLVIDPAGQRTEHTMTVDDHGYHRFATDAVQEGTRYAFRLPDGRELPDPASRWQPDGVHLPSAVFFPEMYQWSDASWRGVQREDLVIYELHVGTFTAQGTFDAVVPRLAELKDLGVTAIELMPVAQFAGDRNWGYDGVYPYAVQNSYGGPRALQRLVDRAHQIGLAVILDVVYNHFGPEGSYLGSFGHYFTDRYHTPWGDGVNFDGPWSDAVRQLVLENARMWVRDFHVDGLRLDAVHAIYDFGAHHILAELQEQVQQIARQQTRTVHVIAESNQNDVRLIDPPSRHGLGLDGVWSDDFHHSVRTLLTGDLDGYYQDFGRAEHLAKAYERVFVYDGCYSPFRKRRYGNPVEDRDRTRFVVCVHNHDQIGNRALGDRSATYLSQPAQRLACGLLLISPCVPLLFMGEEYGEPHPFPFFCSFGDQDLIRAVRRGRRKEFAALDFQWGDEIPDPQDRATFDSAKLTWQWPEGTFHARLRRLYRDLLAARRQWPALRDRQNTTACVLAATDRDPCKSPLLLVQRGQTPCVTAIANLSSDQQPLPNVDGKDLSWMFSTESTEYGGLRALEGEPVEMLPYEMLIFGERETR